jgi:hypothetical protein
MSGRKTFRLTFPLVKRSISAASSGLGTSRPLTTKDSQVLEMPNLRDISTFAPLGLVRKYSAKVIAPPSVVYGYVTLKKL